MRLALLSLLSGACLVFGASGASAEGVRLSDQQLDAVTAGNLLDTGQSLLNSGIADASLALLLGLEVGIRGEEVLAEEPPHIFAVFQNPDSAPTANVLAGLATGSLSVSDLFASLLP